MKRFVFNKKNFSMIKSFQFLAVITSLFFVSGECFAQNQSTFTSTFKSSRGTVTITTITQTNPNGTTAGATYVDGKVRGSHGTCKPAGSQTADAGTGDGSFEIKCKVDSNQSGRMRGRINEEGNLEVKCRPDNIPATVTWEDIEPVILKPVLNSIATDDGSFDAADDFDAL